MNRPNPRHILGNTAVVGKAVGGMAASALLTGAIGLLACIATAPSAFASPRSPLPPSQTTSPPSDAAGHGSTDTEARAAALATSAESPANDTAAETTNEVRRSKKTKKKKTKRLTPTWKRTLSTRFRAGVGAFDGQGTLAREASFAEVRAALKGRVKRRINKHTWQLDVPLTVNHRQTQGVALSETRLKSGATLRWRPSRRLRMRAAADISAVWRPDWPDQYQPLEDGELDGSDRKSFWTRRLSGELYARPFGPWRVRAGYGYAVTDYRQDPNFDINTAPNHLVPSDHSRHEASLWWRYWGDGWKLGAGAEVFDKRDAFARARDAGTGKTNATSDNPNPLQHLRGIEPGIDGELELWDALLEIDVGYGYEIVQDRFQGYYSFTGHRPAIKLTLRPSARWDIALNGELRLRRYGPNSYAEGPGHPPLSYGDRRVDRRATAKLTLSREIMESWRVFASGRYKGRRTNAPNYEPGVYPASRQYDISWSYDNWQWMTGIEFRR